MILKKLFTGCNCRNILIIEKPRRSSAKTVRQESWTKAVPLFETLKYFVHIWGSQILVMTIDEKWQARVCMRKVSSTVMYLSNEKKSLMDHTQRKVSSRLIKVYRLTKRWESSTSESQLSLTLMNSHSRFALRFFNKRFKYCSTQWNPIFKWNYV